MEDIEYDTLKYNNKKSKINLDFLDPTLIEQENTVDYDYNNPFFYTNGWVRSQIHQK